MLRVAEHVKKEVSQMLFSLYEDSIRPRIVMFLAILKIIKNTFHQPFPSARGTINFSLQNLFLSSADSAIFTPETASLFPFVFAPPSIGQSFFNAPPMIDQAKVFKKRDSQSVDNVADTQSLSITSYICNTKGIYIIRKGNNIYIPTTTTVSEVDSGAAAGAEESSFNFFERKKLEAAQWRKYVSESLCINHEDDDSACFFARLMHDFCISKNKIGEISCENGIHVFAANHKILHETNSPPREIFCVLRKLCLKLLAAAAETRQMPRMACSGSRISP